RHSLHVHSSSWFPAHSHDVGSGDVRCIEHLTSESCNLFSSNVSIVESERVTTLIPFKGDLSFHSFSSIHREKEVARG
ncbi:hypothetical protein PENTCL1PPCAC_16901, partial [Pristionchus entomophagus]